MRCAVLTSPGEIAVVERPRPEPGAHDVLVAVKSCGVCRTDRKALLLGQRDLRLPRVLGHEIAGEVAAVGSAVVGLEVGERVQVYPGLACGGCALCQRGDDHLCAEMRIIGFNLDGGFADYVLVPGEARAAPAAPAPAPPPNLNPLPAGLSYELASLAEPLACCVNLLTRLSLDAAEHVVIFGAGPAGLLSAQLARLLGARQIVVVEPDARRRQAAAAFSDRQLDFDGRTEGRLLQLTQGRGFDAAIPCCPGNAAFGMALAVLAKRGRLGFFSGLTDAADIGNAALNAIHYRELQVLGSYGCSIGHNREALRLLAAGLIHMEGLPRRDISWSELPQALRDLGPTGHVLSFFHP